MTAATPSTATPLVRIASGLPGWAPPALSLGGRVAAAAAALAIAFSESYDRTQVFTVVLACLALASLVPARRTMAAPAAGLAAGALFFSGTSLWSLGGGIAMALLAFAALLGTLAAEWRDRRSGLVPALGFLASPAPVVALVVLIALLVEG